MHVDKVSTMQPASKTSAQGPCSVASCHLALTLPSGRRPRSAALVPEPSTSQCMQLPCAWALPRFWRGSPAAFGRTSPIRAPHLESRHWAMDAARRRSCPCLPSETPRRHCEFLSHEHRSAGVLQALHVRPLPCPCS